ncbi:MAG TPA: cysteine--tRNA ligase [Gemmataceae bacterium]|nr:cysteine--tRNA ligase [Gemmataceae bacterium]
MPLQVYSTLTRKKEPFPKMPGETVTMYVCGPTVYKPSHIGHMVGPVIFDTVKRYLTYLGYKVNWVINITDVDDKLIKRAAELGTTVPALAEKMTADYFDCLKKLNVTGVDHFPRATEHIGDMVEMISTLIQKGYAYPAGGDVYFDVSKDRDYGKLCNRDPEQLEAGARIEVSDKKRNPGDFALWKGAKPGEPAEVQFDSPWGKGRPGWHIECSVMARKLLGDTLDIHGGGLDLQFPHHENELAQSESATGKEFARVWMHNGLLKMGTAKMAGSVGNVVNIADLLQRHSPETVRFLLLGTHYRSPIEYSEERLAAIGRSLQAFYRFFERYERIRREDFYTLKSDYSDRFPPPDKAWAQTGLKAQVPELRRRFLEYMEDDFNTGGAIGVLHEFLSLLNKFADDQKLEEAANRSMENMIDFARSVAILREITSILGLFSAPPVQASLGGDDKLVAGLMQLVIELRNNLRTEAKKLGKDDPAKNMLFAQTDLIRQRLGEVGVTLEDRPTGTTWRVGQ